MQCARQVALEFVEWPFKLPESCATLVGTLVALEGTVTMETKEGSRTEAAREVGEGGAISVEYIALLSLVTLIGAASIVGLGIPLLNLFRYAETIIALPVP